MSTVSGTPSGFRLLYKPNDTVEKTSDELTYSIDGGSVQTLKIDIIPAAPGFSPQAYEASFKAIFLLFILAVVLESALAVLFNWRPFVETFNARAVRPLVAFVVAYIFVDQFSLDVVTSLVNASTTLNYPVNFPGKILTAMVIAGGSAGVNNLMVSLGFRQVKTPATVTPTPPPNKAWIAVGINRVDAVGGVDVFIGPAANTPMVGRITGSSRPGIIQYFLSDRGRFPGYGGHEVAPNVDIVVRLRGLDKTGNAVNKDWGSGQFAAGAIIDFDFTM